MTGRLPRIVLLAGLLLAAALPVRAERFALLVGVNAYPDAPEIPALAGPENDVALMQGVLAGLWRDIAITTLTGPAARRAAILGALDDLARRAGPGDEVTVYLAGHGTQIPSRAEPDGFDELFLPADFSARRVGAELRISGHILDDELGAAFGRIVGAGARLWLIADLCHAGTIERGTPGAGAAQARFALLGLRPGMTLVDLNPPVAAGTGGAPGTLDPPAVAAGRFIGFHAAGEAAQSIELPLDGDRVHGLFTFELARALRAGGPVRFRELAGDTARGLLDWGQAAPAPLFSGALDSPVGARAAGITLRAVDGALVADRGRLDGFAEGDVLAPVAPAAGRPAGRLRIVAAGLTESRVALVADDPPGDPAALPGLRFERVARGPVAPYRVALPDAPPSLLAPLRAAVEQARLPRPLALVRPGEPAELRLALTEAALEFHRDGAAAPYVLPRAASRWDEVSAAIAQIARADFLLDLVPELARSDPGRALDLRVTVTPCAPGAAPRRGGGAVDAPRMVVRDCDTVALEITNRGAVALDLSPFYLGPQGRIYYLRGYEGGDLFGLRLNAGETRAVRYTESLGPGDPVGDMVLLVLADIADTASPHPRDLRMLEGDLPAPDMLRDAAPGAALAAGAAALALRTER